MEFRLAKEKDIENIIAIIKKAQAYFKDENIDQWQNGYPNKKTILKDIEKEESYVLVDSEEIIGTAALSFSGEETYGTIYKGKWLTDGDYAVIHRIAIDLDKRGNNLAKEILKGAQEISRGKNISSIKIDTHKDNIAMQKFLKKNDFNWCGIIYLKDGDERLAFEKIL